MPATHLVVPCYNEAARLYPAAWRRLCAAAPIRLLFVDDGSSDRTAGILASLTASIPGNRARWCRLPGNGGKGAAVRAGLRLLIAEGARWLGYVDADLATPADEIARLVRDVLPAAPQVVLGARVRLLGHAVARRRHRDLLGRLFAGCARRVLGLPIYDTQCGAKFFKDPVVLAAALEAPFGSRWIFDVELIARLLRPRPGQPGLTPGDFREVPVRAWHDVPGSKLRPIDYALAGRDLGQIWWALRAAAAQGGADAVAQRHADAAAQRHADAAPCRRAAHSTSSHATATPETGDLPPARVALRAGTAPPDAPARPAGQSAGDAARWAASLTACAVGR